VFYHEDVPAADRWVTTPRTRLANALGELGHDVDVYTQSVPGEDNDVSTHPNVSVTRITKARPLVVFSTPYFSIACRFQIDFEGTT